MHSFLFWFQWSWKRVSRTLSGVNWTCTLSLVGSVACIPRTVQCSWHICRPSLTLVVSDLSWENGWCCGWLVGLLTSAVEPFNILTCYILNSFWDWFKKKKKLSRRHGKTFKAAAFCPTESLLTVQPMSATDRDSANWLSLQRYRARYYRLRSPWPLRLNEGVMPYNVHAIFLALHFFLFFEKWF